MVPLESPGHNGQGPHWPSHNVHLHQATEQRARDEAPQGQVQFWLPEDPHLQEVRIYLSLMRVNLETWWQKRAYPAWIAVGQIHP